MTGLKKIAVIGGESTGKSTLCEALAAYYQTVWVPEFARTYLSSLGRAYDFDDLLVIAQGQIAAEEKAMPYAKEIIFFDTNLMVIDVWSRHSYRQTDKQIRQLINDRHYDAYLVTAPDIPWVFDPLREHPATDLRDSFFSEYCALAEKSGLPYQVIKGSFDKRKAAAISFIDQTFCSALT